MVAIQGSTPVRARTSRRLSSNRRRAKVDVAQWGVLYGAATAGLTPILPLVGEFPLLRVIPYLYLAVFLPVVMIGGIVLFATRRARDLAPALALVAFCFLGLAWTDASDVPHGVLVGLTFFCALAFAAIVNSRALWRQTARIFLTFASFSGLVMLVHWYVSGTPRLGSVFNGEGIRIIEPNTVGTFFGFAMLVGLSLIPVDSDDRNLRFSRRMATLAVPLLFLCLLLTQSRGALISTVVAIFVMAILGSVGSKLIAFSVAAASAALFPIMPVAEILGRFQSGGLGTLGGRTLIWEQTTDLMMSDPELLSIGVGSGGAGRALGDFAPELGTYLAASTFSGDQDTLRINLHSSYFEWGLTFGLLGLVIGLMVFIWFVFQARVVDKGSSLALGQGLLTFFVMTSLTLTAYRLPGVSVACGALTWAYVSLPRISKPRLSLRHVGFRGEKNVRMRDTASR